MMQDQSVPAMAVEETAGLQACRSMTGSPIREYICSLATELAHMARTEGDENLGAVLDVAASLAQRPA